MALVPIPYQQQLEQLALRGDEPVGWQWRGVCSAIGQSSRR